MEIALKNIKKQKNGQPFMYALLSMLIIFFLASMIIQPAKFINQALAGISAWAFNVLPSVLPFMFFTKVLSSLDTMSKLTKPLSPLSKHLFKTPSISIYTFVMAILSGYPVGSKMVADLYLQGKITQEDAFKMSSFCSTSGPMFIVGAVGIGMFKDARIGYVLFASHIVGAILNGICFRNFKIKDGNVKKININDLENTKSNTKTTTKAENKKENFSSSSVSNILTTQPISLADIVTNSTLSILSVGCIITIFFIVIECFSPLFSLLPTNLAYFLEGIIEITKGCLSISTLSNKFLATTLCSFVISFGGISTLLQSLTMLSSVKMPVKLFAFQKIMHAIFSCLTTILLCLVFHI
jgi:sporulation integral membrane protein YlbJ